MSEASKDGEKGTSHAQDGVAGSGRGRTRATSLDPAWSEPELPARERYAADSSQKCLIARRPDPRRGSRAGGLRRLGRGTSTEFLVARGLRPRQLLFQKLPSECLYSLLTIFPPAPLAAARALRPSVVARPAVVDCC